MADGYRQTGGRANTRRGEVEAMIDGRQRTLCLTLGALAELETALGVGNIAELAKRFEGGRIAARDMIAIIAAGLRGGGNLVADDDLNDMRIEGGFEGAVRLTAKLLASAFGPAGGDNTATGNANREGPRGERPREDRASGELAPNP